MCESGESKWSIRLDMYRIHATNKNNENNKNKILYTYMFKVSRCRDKTNEWLLLSWATRSNWKNVRFSAKMVKDVIFGENSIIHRQNGQKSHIVSKIAKKFIFWMKHGPKRLFSLKIDQKCRFMSFKSNSNHSNELKSIKIINYLRFLPIYLSIF